jgi:hypothetical protein
VGHRRVGIGVEGPLQLLLGIGQVVPPLEVERPAQDGARRRRSRIDQQSVAGVGFGLLGLAGENLDARQGNVESRLLGVDLDGVPVRVLGLVELARQKQALRLQDVGCRAACRRRCR